MSADIAVIRLPNDFGRWDELLALIKRAFAYMDGVIDPPSSAHRLTTDSLREKAATETGFLAMQDDAIVGCVFAAEHAQHFYVGKLAVEPQPSGPEGRARVDKGNRSSCLRCRQAHSRIAGARRADRQSGGFRPPRLCRDGTHGPCRLQPADIGDHAQDAV